MEDRGPALLFAIIVGGLVLGVILSGTKGTVKMKDKIVSDTQDTTEDMLN